MREGERERGRGRGRVSAETGQLREIMREGGGERERERERERGETEYTGKDAEVKMETETVTNECVNTDFRHRQTLLQPCHLQYIPRECMQGICKEMLVQTMLSRLNHSWSTLLRLGCSWQEGGYC